jgi:hypothetical protein
VGFCKLCSKLWRHKSPRLHNLPCLWLKEVMDTITWGKSTKLCATRRSAGLPFMVQVQNCVIRNSCPSLCAAFCFWFSQILRQSGFLEHNI